MNFFFENVKIVQSTGKLCFEIDYFSFYPSRDITFCLFVKTGTFSDLTTVGGWAFHVLLILRYETLSI
jgi:hypothetical protein